MDKVSLIRGLVIVVVYVSLPLLFSGAYQLRVLNLLVVFTLFTVSVNIIFGHTRQLFLCHGALVGIGSYTSTLLSMNLGITPWILFPIGALVSGVVGSFLSCIAAIRRLTIIYLAILTLSFQMIFEELTVGLREITGGSEGFTPPRLNLEVIQGVFNMSRELAYYYLFIIILLVLLLIYTRIINSHVGVAFKTISEDETAAAFLGVNVLKYKVLSAFIGSLVLGLIGGLYGYYNAYVGPSIFGLTSIDVIVLVMLVFGGMGTLLGPLLGAGIFSFINELLRSMGPFTTLVFGILLIVLFLYFREGLVPWLRRLLAS